MCCRRLYGWHASLRMGNEILERVKLAIPIATSYRHTAQNIAFHEVEDKLSKMIPIG